MKAFFLALIFLSTLSTKVFAQSIDEDYVNNLFKNSKYVEYQNIKNTRVFITELNGDNLKDAILEFELVQFENIGDKHEGKNSLYTSGFILYLNFNDDLKWSDFIRTMKRGGQPKITIDKIENGVIYTTNKQFNSSDLLCCPTLINKSNYVVRNNQLSIK